MSLHKGQTNGGSFRKGQKPWWKIQGLPHPSLGLKQSPEMIEKRLLNVRGRKRTQEQIKRISDAHRGKKQSLETIEKRTSQLSGKNHPGWKGGAGRFRCKNCGKTLASGKAIRCVKCFLGYKGKSKLEEKVEKIIKKYKLPYKYTGDGGFMIGHYYPDFVNINGDKKAVEVYWKAHKDLFRRGGFEGWKKDRVSTYQYYGWKTIFIDGEKVTEKFVVSCLK